MTTTTAKDHLDDVIDRAKPGEFESALQRIELGTMLTPVTTTKDVTGAPEATVELDPPAQQILNCRVTTAGGASTGAVGPRFITDAGGTPGAPGANGPGIATLSADGATITLEGTVEVTVVTYLPRPALPLATTEHP